MGLETVCVNGQRRRPFSFDTLLCPSCRGPLDMAQPAGLTVHPAVTLGEGGTPVVHLQKIGRELGVEALFAKLEFLNPTGSFKDRGSALLVSALREHGVRQVAEDSSGNAGASISAYCARAGIRAAIFAPGSAPPMKLAQIAFYGAEVVKVAGDREAVAQACLRHCRQNSVVYASHNLSPLFIEGTKGFAAEAAAQMRPPPDHALFPVGNGSLLIGAWKGYTELASTGDVQRIPRLHCVQSKACMPIAAAHRKTPWTPPPAGADTVAGGIAVRNPPRLHQVLQALDATGGDAVAVEESDIIHWQRRLSHLEGIFVEPTSAAALAGLYDLRKEGRIRPQDRVLVPLTGFGFKDRIPNP